MVCVVCIYSDCCRVGYFHVSVFYLDQVSAVRDVIENIDDETVRAFRFSADQGNADGQYMLGLCYENGFGVTKNQNEAVRYYRLAAAQNVQEAVDALRRLGL